MNVLTAILIGVIDFAVVYGLIGARHVFDKPERNPKIAVIGCSAGMMFCSLLYVVQF